MEPRCVSVCVLIGGAESGGKSGGKTDQREKEGMGRSTGEPGRGKENEDT